MSTTPTLTADKVTQTGARLTLANHTTAWYYKSTASGASCSSQVSAGTSTATLSSLTKNTAYTYKAYSDATCATELTSATTDAEFTTLDLTAGSVTRTGATLTLANHGAAWWYKQTAPSAGTCTARTSAQTTAPLSSLSAGTGYTYKAYSATGCNAADEIASVTFTTAATPPPAAPRSPGPCRMPASTPAFPRARRQSGEQRRR